MPTDAELGVDVDIQICCEAYGDAIDFGGIKLVDAGDGTIQEVISDAAGEQGIAVNYCPFCSEPRSPQNNVIELPDRRLDV